MIGFIDEHREAYGVEPICKVLSIAPSTYHERIARGRIRHACRREHSGIRLSSPRAPACLPRTSRFTVCARYGAR
jgi:hypothetical protein